MRKVKMIKYGFIGILAMLSMVACSEDEETATLVLPSDLNVEIVNDSVTLGKVHITANATNANFYTFIVYENGVENFIEAKDGVTDYTFTNSGSWGVATRANSTTAEFIEKVETVKIDLDTSSGNPNPGNPPTLGYETPLSYPNYNLIWNDEFDGTALNSNDWNYEIGTGNGGWGNNELQYYRQENTTVSNGILTIEAKDEIFNGSFLYTSSRLTTQNKKDFQYGRIDIRAAMPEGQGLWPALWMLGSNIDDPGVGWPKCGEIDVMEMVGGESTALRGDDVVHGTAHWENGNGVKADFTNQTSLSSGKLSYEWHVYSIVWDNQKITWYFDDREYHALDITPADMSEFHQKHFFIFNVAVGGNWPGSPDQTTSFPQMMYVDYIRVFQ